MSQSRPVCLLEPGGYTCGGGGSKGENVVYRMLALKIMRKLAFSLPCPMPFGSSLPPRSALVFIFHSTVTTAGLEKIPSFLGRKGVSKRSRKGDSELQRVLSLTSGCCGKQLGGWSRTMRRKKRLWNHTVSGNRAVRRKVARPASSMAFHPSLVQNSRVQIGSSRVL